MRKPFLPVFLCCIGVMICHFVYAQKLEQITVTLELEKQSLRTAIKKIEKQTALMFVFSPTDIGPYSNLTLPRGTRTVKETLNLLLRGTPLKYGQTKNYVTVFLPEEDTAVANPNAFTIRGKVVDAESLEPLPGVNILIKGTSKGTTTDEEGTYVIEAKNNDALIFSYVGFETYETPVNNRNSIDVWLDYIVLDEVSITNAGYWQVPESKNTGNMKSITAKDIEKQPVSNPLLALQGRLPGVYIRQVTGLPGGRIEVYVRGKNSLRPLANAPLYLIDGVPFPSRSLTSRTISEMILFDANPLSIIVPSDIERIDVLKDADATAIYGSRGANGVILITTKKGHAGKAKVGVDFYTGVGTITSKMNLLNTQQYLQMRREAYRNDNTTPDQYAHDLLTWDTTRYTDWQKELIGQTARITNAQVSVSGGNRNTQFLFGGGFYRETAVIPGEFADQKGSIHFKTNHNSDNGKFTAVLSSSYVNGTNTLPRQDPTDHATMLQPNAPPAYDDQGKLNWAGDTWTWGNPFAMLKQTYRGTTGNFFTNGLMTYALLPHLKIKMAVGYHQMQMEEIAKFPISARNPAWTNNVGSSFFGDAQLKSLIIEPQAEYARQIGGEGTLIVYTGATVQRSTQENNTISATGFPNDSQLENLLAAPSIEVSQADYAQYRYAALFSRINYTLKDRYIINLTARRDGSSRFGPGRQWANFGAVGAGWIFSEETFLRSKVLTFGKIRGSYGITGTDQIEDYKYMGAYSPTERPYQGTGLIPTSLSNNNYGWESVTKLEAGLELGVWANRVMLSTSWYKNRASNQLIDEPLPGTTGQSSIQANSGAVVRNTGWEVELSATPLKHTNFIWTSAFNITIPKNKLLAFPNLGTLEERAYTQYFNLAVGHSSDVRQTYRNMGVDPATGLYAFEDVDEDGALTLADLQPLKTTGPRYYGGLLNSISYKGFQLDIFIQFVKQQQWNYMSTFGLAGLNHNQPTYVLSRWQKPGDVADVQKFSADGSSEAYKRAYFYDGDQTISDASFIRLKNLSVSYTVPQQWSGKLRLQTSKLYVQAQNLFTLTRYKGMDPESLASQWLPPLRVITAGIHFTL